MIRVPIQIRVPIISDKRNCCPYVHPFGYIYLVTNLANGHMYVGQHQYNKPYIDTSYGGSGTRLKSAYSSTKYSRKDFKMIILQWVSSGIEELNNAERYWIDMFGTYRFPFHYNYTEGGDGTVGMKPSEETKEIWRKQRTGKGNPMYGKHHTEEQKEKWSLERKGKQTGVDHPMYGVHRYGTEAPMYGKHHTEESKQKNRLAHLDKHTGSENPRSRAIVQLSLNDVVISKFSYMKEVQKYGFSVYSVRQCCKGLQETHKGYKWKYQ